ncbi:MAG: hypothetical protein ACO2PN_07325 [Pyrobaculum sp.]
MRPSRRLGQGPGPPEPESLHSPAVDEASPAYAMACRLPLKTICVSEPPHYGDSEFLHLRRIRPREAPSVCRLSPRPLGLKQAQNLGDLKQLLKPLQHLLQ